MLEPLALDVRSVWPTNVWPFVVVEVQRLEAGDEMLAAAGNFAGLVSVFEAQDKLAAGLPGDEKSK